MVNIDEPTLNAAHARSMDNRQLIASGGACGCFHCLNTFDATKVTHWGGRGGKTAFCPVCHYDTVLSSRADPIDPFFLRRMNARFFGGERAKLDLTHPKHQSAK
jgi:hypothetical protein